MSTLVIGPSCAGKSTFIHWKGGDSGVVFGFEIKDRGVPEAGFIHYNLLNFAHSRKNRSCQPRAAWPLYEDENFATIMASRRVKLAIVIVAPVAELKQRARDRTWIELTRPSLGRYPNEDWLKILDFVDLPFMYGRLFDMLRNEGVPSETIYSSSECSIPDRPGFLPSSPAFVCRNLAGHYC
jgi:hypothetical protein